MGDFLSRIRRRFVPGTPSPPPEQSKVTGVATRALENSNAAAAASVPSLPPRIDHSLKILNHALLTRAVGESEGTGWDAATPRSVMGSHLRGLTGDERLAHQTRQTVERVCQWLSRESGILVSCWAEGHALLLLIQVKPSGIDVTLYNTGMGLEHHHRREEKVQAYWGFADLPDSEELEFLPGILSAGTIDEIYDRLRELGGTPIPQAEEPEHYMLPQARGTCAWSVNLALLRHQVMSQPGSVKENYQQWKLVKALLDRSILTRHSFASLKAADVATLRVAKTGGDLLLAEMARSPEEFAELRARCNRQVDAWMSKYPEEPNFEGADEPAIHTYRHQRALLDGYAKALGECVRLAEVNESTSRQRYGELVSSERDTRYPDLYAKVRDSITAGVFKSAESDQ